MSDVAEDKLLAEVLALPEHRRAKIIKRLVVESARRRASSFTEEVVQQAFDLFGSATKSTAEASDSSAGSAVSTLLRTTGTIQGISFDAPSIRFIDSHGDEIECEASPELVDDALKLRGTNVHITALRRPADQSRLLRIDAANAQVAPSPDEVTDDAMNRWARVLRRLA